MEETYHGGVSHTGVDGLLGRRNFRLTDPTSTSIADSWRSSTSRALERQLATFVPKGAANAA
jgi:hypothetical protein